MFRTNLVVHHQEHGLIYCITQSGTIMQASLSAKKLCISLVINTLQYDARYIQRQNHKYPSYGSTLLESRLGHRLPFSFPGFPQILPESNGVLP